MRETASIGANIKTDKVYYFDDIDTIAMETFNTAVATERWMKQLKDLLLDK